MAEETKYTYPHTDFPNQKVDLNRLTTEIQGSDIHHSLSHINCSPLFVTYKLFSY